VLLHAPKSAIPLQDRAQNPAEGPQIKQIGEAALRCSCDPVDHKANTRPRRVVKFGTEGRTDGTAPNPSVRLGLGDMC
jgi:hypothetical protein